MSILNITQNSTLNKIRTPDEHDFQINYYDPLKLKKVLHYINQLYEMVQINGNFELLGILLDIQSAIKSCNLSIKEREYLSHWIDGYTEKEIADIKGAKQPVVHRSITNACKKISAYLTGSDRLRDKTK